MLWLALDTSQQSGSVALEKNGTLIYQCYFNVDITHSETLMPQVDAALKCCGFSPEDLHGVITTIGPGSFTGLRIGLATAKGIAFGRKIPLLTYSTLETIATNCYTSKLPILVCLDAKMKELYAALYSPILEPILEPCVIDAESLAAKIDKKVLLVGNAPAKIEELLLSKGLQPEYALAHQNLPMAAALFSLRRMKPQPEIFDFEQLAALAPQYLRESTAQIKFNQKKKQV